MQKIDPQIQISIQICYSHAASVVFVSILHLILFINKIKKILRLYPSFWLWLWLFKGEV